MIQKILRKSMFFLALLAATLFFSCGGGSSSSDDEEEYDIEPGSSLTESDFHTFRSYHDEYFETGFADLIEDLLAGYPPLSNYSTYYISPTGSDYYNNGLSEQAPFATFSHALSQMLAGDTLIVMDGTYTMEGSYEGMEVNKYGSYSSFTTIKAQNKGKAIISGGNTTKNNDYALMSISGIYIMVDGLVFKDLKAANGATGIRLENGANHIVIANCEFKNIKTASLVTEASKDDEDLQYTANAIIGYGNSNSAPISSILVYKNRCTDMETGWGECISLTENCTHVSIIDNYIDNTGNIGIDVGGNYVDELLADRRFTRYAYIAHNTVVNESTSDTYGDTCYGIYADGGQHIQIIGNKVENCMGGIEAGAEEVNEGYPTDDIWIRSNELINCGEVFFACGGYEANRGWVTNVHFLENTCLATHDADCMVNLAKCNNVEIKGNTFKKTGNFGIDMVNWEYNGWNLSPTPTVNDAINENTWIGF